ncbi:MAG: hypothetical protein A3B96_03180 [Candidatus Spechtbacteria bacterium RIFCSPHIGHO2_02_FULL_43_15b]|uniref:Uncharacterized protein n=1 Tax=Candidatus Spechtbacteria bacterium RIFCSPHIGHO2_01_FULL_43_30 TaxID=1802158 RepID=A0A1G2H8C8_9BACT|nr:MAG: hypothetical protein A2827_00470 [Candidatus Spechtbacteria bacterium RIFCSPHIGHO2_01_FULL_43_30]OGZ59746.1 MAG: hypothetical protein A3B96_03180 [Candidatus Spechtbacteria bacterium RIFCSPHIGHO2_02_FULL_43_15b]
MTTAEQLKKIIDELELSNAGRKKANEIFAMMEKRGMLREQEKQMLLDLIDAEMFLGALQIKAIDANIEEITKVLSRA